MLHSFCLVPGRYVRSQLQLWQFKNCSWKQQQIRFSVENCSVGLCHSGRRRFCQSRTVVSSKRFAGRRKVGRLPVTIWNSIAQSNEPTNLDANHLHDELQRYGVDMADYGIMTSGSNREIPVSTSQTVDSKTVKKEVALRKRKAGDLSVKRPSVKHASGVIEDWCAYLLLSADSRKTYVGVTFDIKRRLRQHNGEIAGGAKAARAGRPWSLVCTVRGFGTRSEACQFEWRWKAAAAKKRTLSLFQEKEVYTSPLILRRRVVLEDIMKSTDEWKDLLVEWRVPASDE